MKRFSLALLLCGLSLPAAGQSFNFYGFGVIDGKDDAAVIQRAIDAVGAAKGADIVFPPGTYRLNRAIDLRPLIGGSEAEVVAANSVMACGLRFGPAVAGRIDLGATGPR